MPSPKPEFVPQKILMVDDNRLGLSARRSLLEELGYQITPCHSAEEALERFNDGFDLVVTDYRMAKMNGVELIGRLKQARPDVPAILISGFVDALGLTEASTGADVVIQKSNNEVAHLVRAVNRLLKKKPARKAGMVPAARRKPS
jgi:CheY-like chemotaxis protein